jgi:uncharacterized cofD-like protein
LLPYLVAAVFLIFLALFLLAMKYRSAIGLVFSDTAIFTIIIWICVIALFLIGMTLLYIAKDKYRHMMNIAQRRAALRDKAMKEAKLEYGLKITAIGGGTGLSTILRGLKQVTHRICAIVTVTDDGGSSGRLLGGNMVLPPGDIRNCLVALSPREGIMEKLFNYRFESPEELKGHSLGNLLISGLTDINGDAASAVRDIGRVLNIRGKVIPVTLDHVTLGAVMDDETELFGETTIVKDQRKIHEIFLKPHNVLVNAEAIDAIIDADVILLGPGSLYTSIIPNLVVPGIIDALIQSPAPVYYVANIMTQKGETEGYNLSDHVEAIVSLSQERFLDGVIVNTASLSAEMAEFYEGNGLSMVENDIAAVKKRKLRIIGLPLVKEDGFVKHDADELAAFLSKGRF